LQNNVNIIIQHCLYFGLAHWLITILFICEKNGLTKCNWDWNSCYNLVPANMRQTLVVWYSTFKRLWF